ncbi:MAG TPA: hypothetical protein VGJ09_16250 [Bryobacteraceae bacterium]
MTTITAVGLGLALGWGIGTQPARAQAPTQNWKSTAEFDLYTAFTKATGKGKIEALDKWKQGFPDSDFAFDREEAYLGTYQELAMMRQYFDKAVEILKTHPNHFFAIYAVETALYQLNPVQPADLDAGERVSKHVMDDLDTIFAPANMPKTMNAAQWTQTKGVMKPLGQRQIAWIAVQRKDYPKAETELTKFLQLDPSQAQFSYFLAQSQFNQRQEHPDKQPSAIFHFTRAATLDGPNAMAANDKKTALAYVTNLYNQYHGSNTGFDTVLAAAKAGPFPPAGFTIDSGADIARAKAIKQAADDAANPILAFWRDIVRDPLQKEGDAYFSAMKGALLPGEPGKSKGFDKFKAKLISMDPPTKPKTLVLALEKPDVPDVTLKFEEPLPGTMEPGAMLEFEGQPDSFTKDPFMVTFLVDMELKQLVGWEGKNAPGAKKGPAKGPAKAGTKGKAK